MTTSRRVVGLRDAMNILPSRGRPGVALFMTVERELTHQDRLRLVTLPKERVARPSIQRFRATHQAAARLVAEGRSHIEVAIVTGYTKQYVSDLTRLDPAFGELVEYYRQQIEGIAIDDAQRLHLKRLNASEASLDEMNERLGDDKKRAAMSMSELRQIADEGLDRTVLPRKTAVPQVSTPTQITFNIQGPRNIKLAETIDAKPEKSSGETEK